MVSHKLAEFGGSIQWKSTLHVEVALNSNERINANYSAGRSKNLISRELNGDRRESKLKNLKKAIVYPRESPLDFIIPKFPNFIIMRKSWTED